MTSEIKVIGITGGIGAGKSTVSDYLERKCYTVIDADKVARSVIEPGAPALDELKEAFGSEIVDERGELNRKKVSEIAFSGKENVRKLNGIMHKYIIEYIDRMIENQRQYMAESGSDLVTFRKLFIDAPLLFETGLAERCDETWLITADDEKRIERAAKKYMTTREEIKKRIEHQMSESEKSEIADIIVENNGEIDELIAKIKEIL